jgi:hypothetical protein
MKVVNNDNSFEIFSKTTSSESFKTFIDKQEPQGQSTFEVTLEKLLGFLQGKEIKGQVSIVFFTESVVSERV